MELRNYQNEAIESFVAADHDPCCIVIPTGGGKTPIIAELCRRRVRDGGRVIVLAHVRELLEQCYEKIMNVAPELLLDIGIFSAGLGSKILDKKITIAGVQSLSRIAEIDLPFCDLLIVDEAHMIPRQSEGMYQKIIAGLRQKNDSLKILGLTATPYRMTSGPICDEKNILRKICYEISVQSLVDQKFLCPLTCRGTETKTDTSSVKIRGGEFVDSDLQLVMSESTLVQRAVDEILRRTNDRQQILIFASGISHAGMIRDRLQAAGATATTIFGSTPDIERSGTLQKFKNREVKFLVNVGVLTTGFDSSTIDCVVLLRPTMSPGLYYQMVGRGLRIADGKTDCLILDFGENILRHGPITDMFVSATGDEKEKKIHRECPKCQLINAIHRASCAECGFVFPVQQRKIAHDSTSTDVDIMSGGSQTKIYDIAKVFYEVHAKYKSSPLDPRTVKITYITQCDRKFSEYLCVEHAGYARQRAAIYWSAATNLTMPDSAYDAARLLTSARVPQKISVTIIAGDRFPRIKILEYSEREGVDVIY